MTDDELDTLKSIDESLRRLADFYAPRQRSAPKPARLSTAAYTEEERNRIKLKSALKEKMEAPQPPGGDSAPA